jgi:hypothetical protein
MKGARHVTKIAVRRRRQYLNFASIFAAAYGLIWELSASAFAKLVAPQGGPEKIGSMLYFSFTTLTNTDYGGPKGPQSGQF